MKKMATKVVLIGGVMVSMVESAFATVDVTPITNVLPDVATVGTAVFGVAVAIYAIKVIRRAL